MLELRNCRNSLKRSFLQSSLIVAKRSVYFCKDEACIVAKEICSFFVPEGCFISANYNEIRQGSFALRISNLLGKSATSKYGSRYCILRERKVLNLSHKSS